MLTTRNTFSKEERLCSKKAIEDLFSNGSSLFVYPLQVIWRTTDRTFPGPAQMAVAVPKKNFKLAVNRNLLKRRIREAYRLHKVTFYEQLTVSGKRIDLIVIYKETKILDFITIEKAVSEALRKLGGRLSD